MLGEKLRSSLTVMANIPSFFDHYSSSFLCTVFRKNQPLLP